APAIPESPIGDETFRKVFALSPIAVLASMIAYLCAQYVDIAIYHFWKRVTKGKYLWIRNNFSTFLSQFIDTFTVVGLLCVFGVLPWTLFTGLVISGFLFKVFIALIDTPFLYFFVYILRKRFGLKMGEEIALDI
ncbi:queuosine precursor transporter, partial [Muriicola sp.]